MFDNGSEIVRADFHLHTRADKEFKYNHADDRYILEYVEQLKSEDIKVGIITNHNKFDYEEYKALRKAAKKENIFLLPGVELSVKEGANGVHTLIVFNPDEWLENGNNHISAAISSFFLGISNAENENTRCNKDLNGINEALEGMNKDYFIIFAHVEQKNGLWNECDGGLITSLSNNAYFRKRTLGFQKVRTRDELKKVQGWMKYEVACVEGSDPKSIEEIGKGNKKTFLKIGDYSYNAVKYSLCDFKNRVFSEIINIAHGYVECMRCFGGKLSKQEFKPSPELNTLIGVRGSGKSSVLEVLRYGLNIEAAEPDNKYKNGLVQSVLGNGGKVLIDIVTKNGKKYTIERIKGEEVEIYDEFGNTVPLKIDDIIKNPLYFGQKDLALTRAGYELELLNKILGTATVDVTKEIESITTEIVLQLDIYREMISIPGKIEELENKNAEIKHKLKIYEEKGITEKLKKQTTCNNDLVKLSNVYNKLNIIRKSIESDCVIDDIEDLQLQNYETLYNEDILKKASVQVDESIGIIREIESKVAVLAEHVDKIGTTKEELKEKISSLKEEFAEIKREIDDESLDLDTYVIYQKMLTDNSNMIKEYRNRIKEKNSLEQIINSLFEKRQAIFKSQFEVYEENTGAINQKQQELKINIMFQGDKESFNEQLHSGLKGTGITDSKYDVIVEKFIDFADIVKDYYLNSGKRMKDILTDSMYVKFSQKMEDEYRNLIKNNCPDKIEIKYHNKLLSKHSLGQRASALILFILTQNDSDLIIIDQPEDDLDNQVIYKELIKTIREKKKSMQFIFATHNANIPVLGDAERIVAVNYDTEKEVISLEQGTIDSENSHKSIVDIMEGGEEAFEKRKEIYQMW